MQQKMTISKTITVTKDDRKLHTLTVIVPTEAEQFKTSTKSEGIILLNRTVFPMGCFARSHRPKNIYPKLAKIKLSNLLYVCNDIEAKLVLQLSEDINHSPILQRETCIITKPGQYVYTGRAILEVKKQNEEQEKKLTDWSYKSRIDGFKMWEGVEISFHIHSLHECQKCKMSGRQEKGHHDDWCNIGNQKTNNPNKPDIFSVNIFSIGNPAKLHSLIKKCEVLKKSTSFILCIQEAKISKLTIIHLSLLDKYNLIFDFIPGSNNSGGFLTLWSSNLSPAKRIASSTGCELLKFVTLDWFIINVYANPNAFQAFLNSLKLSIRFLPKKLKTIMMDDFNALSYDNINSSSILKLNDARIKRFAQLKEQILDCFGFVDFALKNDFCDYTYYDKQHKSFARIDYVFINFETGYDSMQSTQISISDHLLLHVFVKPSNLYQRGPSYWKLNEEIFKNNASLNRDDLNKFFENESPSS